MQPGYSKHVYSSRLQVVFWNSALKPHILGKTFRRPEISSPHPSHAALALLRLHTYTPQLLDKMFAVPGWNVAAAVKAQVETPKPKDPNKLGKKAQKRKEKQENEVNAENFVEHWDNVANGKGTKPVETKKPEAKVKVKDTKPVETQKAEANGVEATDDAAEEKQEQVTGRRWV
jgi:hypothetical protein